jgi:hypothetical protein
MTGRQVLAAVAVSLAVASIALLAGCAAKKAAPPGVEAVTMAYRMAEGKPATYRTTQTATQTMEVMSQYINIDTRKTITFSVAPGAAKDGGQILTVTVDSLEASMTTPQGDFTADASSVFGKSFEMALSGTGVESDLTGADMIQYSVGAAGQRSIRPDFEGVFPDLTAGPVKVGDTWTTADTVAVDEGGMKMQITMACVSTLEGMEPVAGTECARIRTATTGTIKGEGTQQGAPVVVDATMEGTDLWFFAHKEGMLARYTSDQSIKGTATVGGQQGMAIPMKQQVKTETMLVQ